MRSTSIPIAAIAVLTLLNANAELTSTVEFPRIGASYQLTFDKSPEGQAWPNEVKIIAKGDGQWYLVEYERTVYPRRRLQKPDSEPTATSEPTPSPTPVITTHRQWINFAVIVAANEVK